jgi:single-stranded DNA-specific DHH superfamily exonuclease
VRDIGKGMSRYVLGSEEMFHDFVNSISKKDKIGLITHIDLDGIASAIFLQKILESRGLQINSINFLEYNLDNLKLALKKDFDVLFFTDWKADDYPEELEEIRKKSKLLVFDHHPINLKLKDKSNIIKTNYDYCSTHALFDLAGSGKYFDTKEFEWLVCAAIIADYTWDKNPSNFYFIKSIYPEVKKDQSIWNSEPGKIGKKINGSLIYYAPDYKKIYNFILDRKIEQFEAADKIINNEVEKWRKIFEGRAEHFPEARLYFAYGNPKYNITSTIASILSDETFREHTVIFASNFKNKNGFVKLSARDQTGKVDLGGIFKKCSLEFENADGGGHPRAASAIIMKKDLEKFKERLLIELKQCQ